jgi:hypothetical protein
MSIEEIKEKIKSIKSWSWYFEENEFDDFYEIFKERYPEVELDEKKIKRLGKALAQGKEVPIDIKEEIQGNNVAFKCIYNDSGFNGRCSDNYVNTIGNMAGFGVEPLLQKIPVGKAMSFHVWKVKSGKNFALVREFIKVA